MNSSFPDRWSFSYLKFIKYVTNIIAEPKYRTSNSKEPQQKYRLGTVSIKILGGLNCFYGIPTSPSASVMAQNIQWFGPREGFLTKPRAKPEVFNISRGTLRMLMNGTFMFDRYSFINSKKTPQKLRKCLRNLFVNLTTIFLRAHAFYKYPRFGTWPGTYSHDDLKA